MSHLCVATVIVVSCACGSRPAASPTVPAPVPVPNGLTRVEFRGQVVEVDTGVVVPDAQVTIIQIAVPGRYRDFDGPVVRTDSNGSYVMTAELPSDWKEALVETTGSTIEPSIKYFTPHTAGTASLEAYRVVRIRPGESVETQITLRPYSGPTCGWESWLCRRIVIAGWAAGMKVDVELAPVGSEQRIGIIPTSEPWPFAEKPGQAYPQIAEVASGAVWIFGVPSRVRLTARLR